MLFYILFVISISSILGISYFYPQKSNYLQWVVVAILIVIAGFRHHVGIDYDSYINWYINKTRDSDFEAGFLLIMKAFRAIHLSYLAFFFFFSFFTIIFTYLGIKKYTSNTGIALLFFFLIPELYLGSFNLIRQSFAVGISFYAFYYLNNKKFFIFSLLMLFGISIHNAAIFALVVFLIVYTYSNKINSRQIAILLFISFILSQLNCLQIFEFVFKNTRYSYYFESPREKVSLFKTIVLNGIALLVLMHFEKLNEKYRNQKGVLILYFCSMIFMNLFNTFANIERLTYFFKIFEIVVIADLIYLGIKERKIGLFAFFFIYYLSAFFHTLNANLVFKSSSKLIPYQTFVLEEK